MEKQVIEGIWREWIVDKKLGSGGFGNVYEVSKKDYGGKEIVKKAVKICRFNSGERDEIDKASQEVVFMRNLSHKNVISIEDYCFKEIGDEVWIVILMELMDGSLENLIEHTNSMKEKLVYNMAIQVCSGLDYIHHKKIVHRDIKPANILYMINDRNEYIFKIADFGVAKVIERTSLGTSIGTINYKAPELFSSHPQYGKTIDIYSLGLTLYNCMNHGKDVPSLLDRMQGKPVKTPSYFGKMGPIIEKACKYNPSDRYASALDMQNALKEVYGNKFNKKKNIKRDNMGWNAELEKQAKFGDKRSQFYLGNAYLFGLGVQKNKERGLYWLKKSAEQEYIKAIDALIDWYRYMEKNSEEVDKWEKIRRRL